MRKNILLCYQYFYPGYKAGGPIQSLVNMIDTLSGQFNFAVFTSAYDLNEVVPYKNIKLNQWNSIQIGNSTVDVWYASDKISKQKFLSIVNEIKPQFLCLNGMYGEDFFLNPLLVKKQLQQLSVKIIISPRGMLQKGALSVKPFKKKIYYSFLKLFGVTKNVSWHATDSEESDDIKKMFGNNAVVTVAPNIPKKPISVIQSSNKRQDRLSLVYLSIITPKKNLLLLLQILQKCTVSISLAIYGPIKENEYWNLCNDAIKQLPQNISVAYKGDVLPQNVQETFSEYDASILLTQGENFGHALFESLSAARPIITSNFTNWNELQKANAGWNIDIQNKNEIINLLQTLAVTGNVTWNNYCLSSHKYATDYFNQQNFAHSYGQLFS